MTDLIEIEDKTIAELENFVNSDEYVIAPDRKEKIIRMMDNRQPDLTAVFENIHDPHNVAACLRSCDAVGVMTAHWVHTKGNKFPKAGDKTAAGTNKWIDMKKYKEIGDCLGGLKSAGYKIYTTHLAEDSVSLYDLDFTQPCAIILGNEHSGVSDEALKFADANVIIPQVGMGQSLNISVACAVIMYEAYRQRRAAGMYDKSRLSPEEYAKRLEFSLMTKGMKRTARKVAQSKN